MPVAEPSWWYGRERSWQAALLSPVAALYGAIASRRIRKADSYRSRLPVICVGNFTAGGSGKTPLALLLGKLAAEDGLEPWFLSRGYGGKLEWPVRVDPLRHGAGDVGDEPLLLARAFPTVIARDRRKGAEAIEAMTTGATGRAVIIMDDGLQNPALVKDLAIAIVDARRGFGNRRVIPAGPLRAPLDVQLPLVKLIVIAGRRSAAEAPAVEMIHKRTDVPIVYAETRPKGDLAKYPGRAVLAFAGIANPDRFFSMCETLGATVIEKRAFDDHHSFSEAEARQLLEAARRSGAALVTTEKDLARLAGASGALAELASKAEAPAIETVIDGAGIDVVRAALRQAVQR